MKKLVLIVLVAILGVLNANAQEIDSLKTEQVSIVDSLSMELITLRHDYEFLKCDYEIFQLQSKLQIFINEINIKANSLLITYYNNRFDVDLYVAYLNNYTSCEGLFDAYKDSVESKKLLYEVNKDKFSFLENEYLSNGCNLLDRCLEQGRNSLDYYKMTLDTYKKKR